MFRCENAWLAGSLLQLVVGPGGSVRGERANFTGLVIGCIESKFCKKIYVGSSYRRDLHNALLCTVLVESVWVKKYTKINIEKMKSGKS